MYRKMNEKQIWKTAIDACFVYKGLASGPHSLKVNLLTEFTSITRINYRLGVGCFAVPSTERNPNNVTSKPWFSPDDVIYKGRQRTT